MEKITGNEPAFGNIGQSSIKEYQGLTIRQYFAGLAMQGMIANPNIIRPDPGNVKFEQQKADFSAVALEYAESLINELNKE